MKRWARYFRPNARQDVGDEIRFHLAAKRDELIVHGVPPADAEREARRQFGDLARYQDLCIEIEQGRIRRMEWHEVMGTYAQDLRHAIRRLTKAPLFTAAALLTLALGLGANAAIFTVVRGVLLKPLPYPEPDRLVSLPLRAPGLGISELPMSLSTYLTCREEGRAFEGVGLWQQSGGTVTGNGPAEHLEAIRVTVDALPLLQPRLLHGRHFNSDDATPGSPDRVILSHAYWQLRHGTDPKAIGRTIRLNGKQTEIIGVLPPGFAFLDRAPAFYIPARYNRAELFVGSFNFNSIARLKPGVTEAAAASDMGRILALMPSKFPMAPGMSLAMFNNARIASTPRPLLADVVGDIGSVLWVVMAAVGIVLLVACANVANLLLVRAEGRQQEFAVRAALGAGWSRLARELLIESTALGLGGGVLGAGVAYAAIRWLRWLAPAELPRLDQVTIDPIVFVFIFALSLASGLFFGLFPVLRYARPAIRAGLRARASRESYRTRYVLAVAQVALALVLLVSCGLMLRTAQALRNVNPGFTQPERVLAVRVSLLPPSVPEPLRVVQIYKQLVERVMALPGVEAAGLAGSVPMDGSASFDPVFVEERPPAEGKLPAIRRHKTLAPGHLRALGQPLLAGRDFTWTDLLEMRRVAIVNAGLAHEYWVTPQAALGKRIRERPGGEWREIVGVVGDTRDDGAHLPAPTSVYWPTLKDNFWNEKVDVQRSLMLTVRTARAGDPGFVDELRRLVWSIDRDIPFGTVRTMQERHKQSMARTSFILVLLAMAGALALVLGVVGIYGVIAHSVVRRTREIGIRLALGSPASAVTNLFLRQGLWMAGVGVVLGLAAAWPLARLLETLLYGVKPLDPLTYAGVAVGLVAVTLAAAWIPSARATSVDPARTLRTE